MVLELVDVVGDEHGAALRVLALQFIALALERRLEGLASGVGLPSAYRVLILSIMLVIQLNSR